MSGYKLPDTCPTCSTETAVNASRKEIEEKNEKLKKDIKALKSDMDHKKGFEPDQVSEFLDQSITDGTIKIK